MNKSNTETSNLSNAFGSHVECHVSRLGGLPVVSLKSRLFTPFTGLKLGNKFLAISSSVRIRFRWSNFEHSFGGCRFYDYVQNVRAGAGEG